MITIRRILCPCDFSEFSTHALGYATALAKWYESSITALHVHPSVPPPPSEMPVYPQPIALTAEMRETIQVELRRFAGRARSAGVPIEAVLLEGDPVTEILRYARAMPADLVILGTHGRGGFERWVLGSVTEKVLRKAPCPVLTVPRSAPVPAPADPAVFRRILCPIDFSRTSLRALDYAFSLAKEADAGLVLMHASEAFPDETPVGPLRADVHGYLRELEEVARQRLHGLVPEGAREWCKPEILVAPGKPYREILRVAQARETDLIVMGVQGRNALDLMLFGSTTQHVVRQAACPVLTIRAS